MRVREALRAAAVAAAVAAAPAATATAGNSPWTVVQIEKPLLAWARVESGTHAGCHVLLLGERTGSERSLALACETGGVPAVREIGPAPRGTAAIALAGDLPADGPAFRLLLGVPGGVDAIDVATGGRAGAPRALLRDADVHPYSLDDRPDLDGDGRADLVQALHGGVGAWRALEDGRYERLGVAPIAPVGVLAGGEVNLFGRGALSGAQPTGGDGPAERWIGTRDDVRQRIGVTRVPLSGERAFEPCGAWVRTDHPSSAMTHVVIGGGAPRLAALVTRTDRASLLGEYELLVAPLACDPTRRGRTPEMVVRTKFPLGGLASLTVRDVDGDGRDDLVAYGLTGRLRPSLAVFAWRALGDGSFDRRPVSWDRRIRPNAPLVLDWSLDVDGDGLEDLVASAEDGLIVVPSEPGTRAGIPLAKRPWPAVPWPPGHAARALIGTTGGRLLFAGSPEEEGGGAHTLLFLDSRAAGAVE